ncbi:MAG: hypothetical protein A3G95_02830 [Flavobacteria bacterium RIFCSPLOWO2_12_FULL_31_7]|nr:MAG: hypothetical protein A3G95_02830 [Flavobacteria bacterium RIFCSPLOWO2_12_FULL_31_7]
MKDFKIVFPSGYSIKDTNNDNIDINVIFNNKQVFFATFFTVKNIITLMKKEKTDYFWADSMVIIESIEKKHLRNSIDSILEEGSFESIFSKIGNIEDIYGSNINYKKIIDFSNGFEIK